MDRIDSFKYILEFGRISRIGKYLGFPILTGRVTKKDFNFILDKIQSRLAGWKSKLLNKAGKATLAKYFLEAIPTYTMQNAWILEGVWDNIDANIHSFLLGKRHTHWVDWNSVTQSKALRGLGIRKMCDINVSLC